MSMVVKHNMSAINTLNTLNVNQTALTKSLKKVASGMKINGAADDASGYAISERMRVQIRSLDQANQNAQNGSSMLKVAEGAVSSTVEILKTMKEKAVNAANDTNTDDDRRTIQKELDQSIDQINDNANVTFNGQYLVDGSHNRQIKAATRTTMTNFSLNTATKTSSKLTELKTRSGDNLNIQDTDTVTVSWVKDGVTYTTSTSAKNLTLSGIENLTGKGNDKDGSKKKVDTAFTFTHDDNKIGKDASDDTEAVNVYTPDGQNALTIGAKDEGVEGQISGLTIYVTDKDGNVRKSANAALDAFSEQIRAENTTPDNSINLQIGTKAGQSIKVGLTDMKAQALGLQGKDNSTVSVATQELANAAINVFDAAIQKALDQQTSIGAAQSRLEYTQSNLTTASENVTAAESTIRDADMAKEMTEYTKNNVLMQAAQSMLAQANQSSSNVLSLLQ